MVIRPPQFYGRALRAAHWVARRWRYRHQFRGLRRVVTRATAALVGTDAAYRVRKISSGRVSKPATGVTQQHDARVQYKRKSMPRRKKSKWIKFTKRVRAVVEKSVGTQSFLFNDTTIVGSESSSNQAVFSCMMYGGSLANEQVNNRGYSDINKIMNIVSPTGPANPTSVSDLARTGKLQFVSAVLDITVKNTASDVLELDMYEVYFRGHKDIGQSLGRTIEDAYQGILNAQTEKGGSPMSVLSRGWTPFNCGAAVTQMGAKIYKKTKFFIGSGQVITHQKRDPKSHYIGYNQAVWQKDCWAKGYSYLVFFIGKATPGSATPVSYVVGNTRSYNAKMYQFSGNTDQIVT